MRIVPEHKLRAIFQQIPEIRLNDNVSREPNFHWGDKTELNRYLALKKDDSYPLIWYLLPTKEEHIYNGQKCIINCSLLIATREANQDLFNDIRYDKSYSVVLEPLADYVIEGLDTSSISKIISTEWNIYKFPNYTEENTFKDSEGNTETKMAVIDLWDALRIDLKVEISNNCLKQIQWLTKK